MKKLILFISLLIAVGLTAINAQPVITSFSPTSGPIGTAVTITGNNFGSATANNIVFFGATKATVTDASTTSLKVIAPDGATYEPITVTTSGLTAYSAAPFIVTFQGGGGAFDANSFAPKIDFATDTNPFTTFLGDLDGDGKTDLVCGSYTTPVVTIFRNTSNIGTISFAPKIDLQVVGYWSSCTIGDIDGDGKLDLAVGNFNTNTLSVFRNTSTPGNISFAARQDYATGVNPQFVSIGDLDGDGKSDIVTANYGSDNVSVFRNTSTPGNISLASKIDFESVTSPFTNSIGDLDGDGKPEIVVATQGNSFFSILRNTSTIGNISFAAKVDYDSQGPPWHVVIGDLDGDGKADLAAANNNGFSSGSVSLFRNTSVVGAISFAPRQDYFLSAAGSFYACLNDLNGDGKPDLAVNCYWSDELSIFRNTSQNGSISLEANVLYNTGSGPQAPNASDLDGDGKPDIALHNLFGGTISVLRNQIVTGTSCAVPTGEATTNITGTTAKLSWTAVNGAAGYAIRYRVTGSNQSIFKTTYNSKKLTGLAPNTSYTWQVKTYCSLTPPAVGSDWSSSQQFTTGSLKLADEQPATFNVYPNPTSGQFTIAMTLNDQETSSAMIQVINLVGQIVYTEKTSVANGLLQKEIKLNDLPAGMYYVKVIVNDQVYSAQLNYSK